MILSKQPKKRKPQSLAPIIYIDKYAWTPTLVGDKVIWLQSYEDVMYNFFWGLFFVERRVKLSEPLNTERRNNERWHDGVGHTI